MACLMGGVFLLRGNVLAFVLPMLYLILHIYTWLRMKQIWQGRELNKCLGETARNIFVYGIMLSVGILFG